MRFLTGSSPGLLLETKQLDNLWSATTQSLKNYSKPKKIISVNNKSLNNSRSVLQDSKNSRIISFHSFHRAYDIREPNTW
jgi:hypothetical protein